MPIPLVVVGVASWVGTRLAQSAALAALVAVAYWTRDYLKGFALWLYQLFPPFFDALFLFAKDVLIWLFESMLDLILVIVDSLEFDFTLFNPASYLPSAGTELINVLQILKVPTAIGMILAAIVIRLLLQLIPFTRLGS